MVKKRVLMVSCEGLSNGGVQAIMMGIVRNLSGKYQFDMLLFTSEKRYYDDEFLKYGGEILRIPRYEGKNRIRKRLDFYIRGHHVYQSVLDILKSREKYDVVHCNNEFEGALVLKAAFELGVPIRIMHTHTTSFKSNFIANFIEDIRRKQIDNFATLKVGCSRESNSSFYLHPESAIVMNNFYDDNKFYFCDNCSNEKLSILHVGRYCDLKNQKFIIRIMYEVVKKVPDAELNLVGFPIDEYADEMRRLIFDLNLNNNVKMLPGESNVPQLLSQSTCFVFPSRHEGFGLTLIEAQAVGVRCYASSTVPQSTNCGGVCYMDINVNPEIWAKKIVDDFISYRNKHVQYDVTKYSSTTAMKSYSDFYENKFN